MKRLAFALLLLPVCAFGELTLYTVAADHSEIPVGMVQDVGSGPAGDTLSMVFRLRNAGLGPEVIQLVKVTGTGFKITGAFSTPWTVAPGSNYDFTVRFSAPAAGTYSANLSIDGRTVLLKATATATLAVTLDGAVLASGTSIEFGRVERGTPVSRNLALENRTASALTVANIAVNGSGFRIDGGFAGPVELTAGEVRPFTVICAPEKAAVLTATLTVDGRTFQLNALAVEPKPPRPVLSIPQGPFTSAQQLRVKIALSETSRANVTGMLKLALSGSVKDDAVVFTASGKPSLEFNVREGDLEVHFGSSTDAVFQTGTTAATLTVSVDLAGYTDQATIVIAPATVHIDSGTAAREGTNVVLTMNGFDNTRSLSQLAFSFYDSKGSPLTAGPIRVDAGADFKKYFDVSTAGGMFSARAVFPVLGDVKRIAAAEVEMTNASGASRSERLRF